MEKANKQNFEKNLLLTQIYCDRQIKNCDKNSASIFRSINPIINGKKLFEFKLTDYGFEPEKRFAFSTEWSLDPYRDESSNWYKKLFELQLIEKQEIIKSVNYAEQFNGKILVVEIDCSMTDGVSEVSSDGLIDVFDCPPIDTWFYFDNESSPRLLYAWIPREFVYQANQAILVNSVDCIDWYEPAHNESKQYEKQHMNMTYKEVNNPTKLEYENNIQPQNKTLLEKIKNFFK
jgi:hypothetical protein